MKEDKNKIATVTIKFHNMNNLVHSRKQWDDSGGYQGFLKCGYSIMDIECVDYGTMTEHDFYNLPEWNP